MKPNIPNQATNITLHFSVGRCTYPKWYESFSPRISIGTIEIEINTMNSLKLIAKEEIPFLNSYVILDLLKINIFYKEITDLILNKIKNVTEVTLYNGRNIYLENFTKEINSSKYIFFIPTGENYSKIYKKGNYAKYFQTDLFEIAKFQKIPIASEYIGFTGKSKDELNTGVEIGCTIHFANSSETKSTYIYIKGIDSIEKNCDDGIYVYYLLPKDILEQAEHEFNILKNKNQNVSKIVCTCKLFDQNLKEIDKATWNNTMFNLKIKSSYQLEYSIEKGVLLTQINISSKDKFLASYRINPKERLNDDEFEEKYSGEMYGYEPPLNNIFL